MKAKKESTKAIVQRTAIYVRVSTEEQAQEGYSIRGQSEKLKSYALLKDWEIYDIYSDEGISGKNIVDRPAINKMIEDIKSGKVNNVLVFKVDRLTRSTKNLIELVELFEEYNCAFNSLTESIDTDTPSGRMFLKIIGIFAEFERENLVSRLKLGLERKVKEGYTLASRSVSYGYIRRRGNKIQEIEPEEAKIAREIFTMYLDENKSFNGIARTLNDRKIPTKNNGYQWEITTIKAILSNPTYIGKVRYSIRDEDKYFEIDGHHESIISEEIFFLVQDKIKSMANIAPTKKPKDDGYFCGLLVCGSCGSKFTIHRYWDKKDENGEKIYKSSYRCIKKQKGYISNEPICKSPDIGHKKVEKIFEQYIEQINDFTEIENMDLKNNERENRKHEQLEYISTCEKKLSSIQNKKKRFMEQYVNEEIRFDEYREMLDILNKKYEVLEMELQKAKEDMPIKEETSNVSHEDIILNFKENWGYLDNKERMMFLQRFVKRIVVTVEKEKANSNVAKIEEVIFNSKAE